MGVAKMNPEKENESFLEYRKFEERLFREFNEAVDYEKQLENMVVEEETVLMKYNWVNAASHAHLNNQRQNYDYKQMSNYIKSYQYEKDSDPNNKQTQVVNQ